MQSTSKAKLSYCDRSKTGPIYGENGTWQWRDRSYGTIHTENENELWLIELGAIYDQNQIEQQCDQLYRSSLHENKKWTIETYLIVCDLWWKPDRTTMWSIIQVRFTSKLWPIKLGVVYDENQTRQWRDRSYRCNLHFHDTQLSWSIGLGVDFDEN